MSDMRQTSYARPPAGAHSRSSAGWVALVTVVAAVGLYFYFTTGQPEDSTITGSLPPAALPSQGTAGAVAPAPAPAVAASPQN